MSADVDTKAHVHARFDLADTVRVLKRQRKLVEQLEHEAGVAALDVPINMKGPKAEAMLKKQAEANAEKAKFRQMWIEAEQVQPVLTAYRHGGDIMKVDLGDLDTTSVDDEMRAVLLQVLPKIGDIFEARDKIHGGDLSPLSIPSVVAMTKANMFIPKDSLRDGVANDLADENSGDSKWLVLGALLLALVTFFPSGGTSLGIAAGMASVSLAAYTAVHEWEVYSRQKMLSDTDLDIAHSLATEEPSLTPFILSLVSLGLEPIVLVTALNKARKLKALSDVGDDTSVVVKELNEIGQKAGQRDLKLGDQALDDIEAAEEGGAKAAKGARRPARCRRSRTRHSGSSTRPTPGRRRSSGSRRSGGTCPSGGTWSRRRCARPIPPSTTRPSIARSSGSSTSTWRRSAMPTHGRT